jgi:alkanesulfonate monooxygenase SsuD/methylene tetrahydromethanopterin reductase-like flavin-dependent oxidoreductase (luciferase family)
LDESAVSLLELGSLAESLGYDGLWINEEHFGQGSRVCLSPILLATALAMRTRKIRIGFSVLVLPLFEPIRLAEEIATLDVLSEGRVDLGVSRGNTSRYFEAWGLDYEDRSTAFDAGFETLIRYWTEPKVQVGSRTESIEPKCVQRPHPPVYVATYREESTAWIGERGLALFQGSQQSVDSIRRCIGAFKDAGGDVARVPIGRFVVVGESDDAAWQAALPAAKRLTAGYRRGGEQVKRWISTEDELETERWLREVAIVGCPDTVAERRWSRAMSSRPPTTSSAGEASFALISSRWEARLSPCPRPWASQKHCWPTTAISAQRMWRHAARIEPLIALGRQSVAALRQLEHIACDPGIRQQSPRAQAAGIAMSLIRLRGDHIPDRA